MKNKAAAKAEKAAKADEKKATKKAAKPAAKKNYPPRKPAPKAQGAQEIAELPAKKAAPNFKKKACK